MTAPTPSLSPVDELAAILRPAGGGLYLVSTGRAEQLALQRRLYAADDDAAVVARWRDSLARIAEAKAIILGVPSDVGAGFRRLGGPGAGFTRACLVDRHQNGLA